MSAEPTFATVNFCCDTDASLDCALRVPVALDITIRQLAKDAMQRLLHSRRRAGEKRLSIAVTEVRVGGGAHPMAEVFSQDRVSDVVVLREEVLYMKIVCSQPLEEAPTESTTAASTTSLNASRAPPPPPPSTAGNHHSAAAPAPASKAQTAPATPRHTKRRRSPSTDETSGGSARLREREKARLGWGPEAHKSFADNYVSSPEKLMRRRFAATRKEKAAATQQSTSAGSVGCQPATAAPPPSAAQTKPGWGPEADKYFPANYVSSPDRLARRARRMAAVAKGVSNAPVRTAVAVELQFDDDEVVVLDQQGESTPPNRPTIAHHVAPPLEAVLPEERPKGWGPEATKFFDPETYCDDPRKAKMSSEERRRPVRAHRNVVLNIPFE